MRSKHLALLGLIACCGVFTSPVFCQQQETGVKVDDEPAASQNENETAGKTATSDRPVLQHRHPRYQLHSADVLELSFPFSPEFNQTVTVQPDGYISLRGVQAIHVEGQTVPELVKSLKTAYAVILHDPEIDVELKDFEKPYFIVGGEVGRPGKFDLRGDTTVAEAVAIAGGFRETSKHSEVFLFRRVPDGWAQARKVNLKKLLSSGNLQEDPYLQAGDFVYVPKNAFSKIARFIPTSSIGMYSNPAFLR